jgi:uncharacterized membrane protein
MNHTAIPRRGPSTRTTLAIVLFLAAYAGAIVVLLAPKDMLGTLPGSSVDMSSD